MHVMSRVVVSGVRAGWDGNRGYVTAEASVTGRCWGRGCCQHTTWGHRGLILIINQISPISPQTHLLLLSISSCFEQPDAAGIRPAHPKSVWLSGVPTAFWGSTMGTRDGQQAGPSRPARQAAPMLGNSQARVSPGFSRANSSQEQTCQQILGETVAAVSRGDGWLSGWP